MMVTLRIFLILLFFKPVVLDVVKLVARRSNSLAIVNVDLNQFNFTEEKVILTDIDQKYSTNFVLDVRNQKLFVIDERSQNSHDRIQILDILRNETRLEEGKTLKREHASSNELISSQAFDWVTGKVYMAIESVSSKKPGSIEACSANSGGNVTCTVVLNHNAGMHSLVVDPIEGYMYWLNKVTMRIESAWMNGQYLDQNPFPEPFIDDPKVHFAGLTMDYTDRMLYYLRLRQNKVEIIGCKIHYRDSCKVVTTQVNVVHLYVTGGTLFWTDTKGILRFCEKDTCDSSIKVVNTSGWERIQLFDVKAQPERSQNPCQESNGGCSHSCLLIYGDPWKSCGCPPGIHLLSDNKTCDMQGMKNVLFAVTNSHIYYVSFHMDKPVFLPRKVYFDGFDVNVDSITAIAVDGMRNLIYLAEEKKQDRYTAIRRISTNSSFSEYVLLDPNLREVRGLTVDSVTGAIFFINGYLNRIEAISLNGKHRTTIAWRNINPQFLAFQPVTRRLYFVDVQNDETNIVELSLVAGESTGTIVAAGVGHVTDLDVDSKNDVLYWSTMSDNSGTVEKKSISTGIRERLIGGHFILPKAAVYFNGTVYIANDRSKSIDAIDAFGNLKHLHKDINSIKHMKAVYESTSVYRNPCLEEKEDGLCILTKAENKFNVTILCQDQYEYDDASKSCLPPKKLLIFGGQDKFVQFKIGQSNANMVFDENPSMLLPVNNVGHPLSVIVDSLSLNRYIYWIDGHDRESGRIKRASDSGDPQTRYIDLNRDSNCSTLFDMVMDEAGRQVFVSCAPKDAGDVAYIHVWRIDEDEDFEYIGRVVSGDVKSIATNTIPFPKQLAVFGRLNALFYADCSRVLDSAVIVRCHIDGKQCQIVVHKGLDCNSLKLEADLLSPRLIYTTIDGIWSRDVYVDGDLRQLVRSFQGKEQLAITPLDDRSMLVIVSNETRHEDKILELRYDVSVKELSQLRPAMWMDSFGGFLKRITSVSVSGIVSAKMEMTCINSECSHLCRIPYDTGSLERRKYECLCPLDYSMSLNSETECEKNLECLPWQFKCMNGRQCIHMAKRCDGIIDCLDQSDEHFGICHTRQSLDPLRTITTPADKVMWACDSGRTTAVGLHQVCNGMAECYDDSDEKHCRCRFPADEFDCSSWQKWVVKTYNDQGPQCIPRRFLCNGIQDCPNGADELPLLCALMDANNGIGNFFDFSTRQPGYLIVIFAIIAAVILLSIGCCICCYYQKRKMRYKNYGCQHVNMSTLLSGQRTMMTDTATPTPQVTRLLLPSHQQHQVEVALSTYPTGASEYGYIPSRTNTLQRHRLETGYCGSNYNTLGYRSERQHYYPNPQHGEHLVIVRSGASTGHSSVSALPPPHGHEDAAFYAPPPSAASLSTYGVVKPAEMKMPTPRSERRRNGKKRFRETNSNKLEGPPSYSEIGSALECSTPKSNVLPRVKSRRHDMERQKKAMGRYKPQLETTDSSDESESDEIRPLRSSKQKSSSSSDNTGAFPPANSSNSSGIRR